MSERIVALFGTGRARSGDAAWALAYETGRLLGEAGFVIAKIADDVPVKHALLSSLGAFVPFLVIAVMTFTPILLMLAVMAAAGNLNGGMLAVRRRHYHYDPHRDDD